MSDPSPYNGRIYVGDLVERLASHSLYASIDGERALGHFMRAHVFCVWDFQSLVKALQRALTCVEVPWIPSPDPEARRLINEIVLDEESDITPDNRYLSHFELYLEAMRNCGADCQPVEGFVRSLQQGKSVEEALSRPDLPSGVAPFVKSTMEVAASKDIHCVAAVFAYGREEVIPEMFRRLVEHLAAHAPERWSTFLYYLSRHITQDTERHGPLSLALTARLCGDNVSRWEEAQASARAALESRLALWDTILATIRA